MAQTNVSAEDKIKSFRSHPEISQVYLKPAEAHISNKPTEVTTVLGSCLSITMFNPRTRTGAICHAIFPSQKQLRTSGNLDSCFQYVDTSISWMLSQFKQRGIHDRELEIKMFGAASMFSSTGDPGKRTIAVGEKNIKAAVEVMKEYDLYIKAWNVGGGSGRKIIFHTHTGEVFQKFLNRTELGIEVIEPSIKK